MSAGLERRARTAAATLALAQCVFDYDPNQRRDEGGQWASSAGLLGGFQTMEVGDYTKAFGNAIGEATVEGIGGHDWSVRVFESGDAHLVVDTSDGRFQPLKRLDGESMRALAADIETILELDVDDYDDDMVDETGAVDGVHDGKHNWAVSLDADGNIRVHPEGDESSEYMDMSDDEARNLVEALEEMASLHEGTDFGDDEDDEEED